MMSLAPFVNIDWIAVKYQALIGIHVVIQSFLVAYFDGLAQYGSNSRLELLQGGGKGVTAVFH